METGQDAGQVQEDRVRSSDQSREYLSVFTEFQVIKNNSRKQ